MAINNYYHVTDTGAGSKDGSDWDNAFDEPALETYLEASFTAGDIVYIMDGSYTMDSDIDSSARDGTAVSPGALIAVKSSTTNTGSNVVYSDFSVDAVDRPFFDGATYQFKVGDYMKIYGISFQSSNSTRVVYTGSYCIVDNCKIDNDHTSSSIRRALTSSNYNHIIDCEITSANCNGIQGALLGGKDSILYCYIHDLPDGTYGVGLSFGGSGFNVSFNIFDNMTIGISSIADQRNCVVNNMFYETDTGISATTGYGWCVINNIFEGCDTYGLRWTTQTDINYFDKNWGNDARNNDMWSNIEVTSAAWKDNNNGGGDPKITTPGSDFKLDSDSPCIENGKSIRLGV